MNNFEVGQEPFFVSENQHSMQLAKSKFDNDPSTRDCEESVDLVKIKEEEDPSCSSSSEWVKIEVVETPLEINHENSMHLMKDEGQMPPNMAHQESLNSIKVEEEAHTPGSEPQHVITFSWLENERTPFVREPQESAEGGILGSSAAAVHGGISSTGSLQRNRRRWNHWKNKRASSEDGQGPCTELMSKEEKGRLRKEKFSATELRALWQALARHRAILFEGRGTIVQRSQAWEDVTARVNAVSTISRNIVQVKHKWQDLKIHVRHVLDKHTKELRATCGGPEPILHLEPWEEFTAQVMFPDAVDGVGSQDDCVPWRESGRLSTSSASTTPEGQDTGSSQPVPAVLDKVEPAETANTAEGQEHADQSQIQTPSTPLPPQPVRFTRPPPSPHTSDESTSEEVVEEDEDEEYSFSSDQSDLRSPEITPQILSMDELSKRLRVVEDFVRVQGGRVSSEIEEETALQCHLTEDLAEENASKEVASEVRKLTGQVDGIMAMYHRRDRRNRRLLREMGKHLGSISQSLEALVSFVMKKPAASIFAGTSSFSTEIPFSDPPHSEFPSTSYSTLDNPPAPSSSTTCNPSQCSSTPPTPTTSTPTCTDSLLSSVPPALSVSTTNCSSSLPSSSPPAPSITTTTCSTATACSTRKTPPSPPSPVLLRKSRRRH